MDNNRCLISKHILSESSYTGHEGNSHSASLLEHVASEHGGSMLLPSLRTDEKTLIFV